MTLSRWDPENFWQDECKKFWQEKTLKSWQILNTFTTRKVYLWVLHQRKQTCYARIIISYLDSSSQEKNCQKDEKHGQNQITQQFCIHKKIDLIIRSDFYAKLHILNYWYFHVNHNAFISPISKCLMKTTMTSHAKGTTRIWIYKSYHENHAFCAYYRNLKVKKCSCTTNQVHNGEAKGPNSGGDAATGI